MRDLIRNFNKKARIYFNTNILFSVFVISSLINSVVLRFFTVKNVFDLRPLIADLAVILIFGAIAYAFKPKNQFKYFLGISIFFVFIFIINSVYYTNFVSFTSVSLIATTSQLSDVADAVYKDILEFKDLIFLWQIFALFFINANLKKKKYFETVSKIEIGKVRAANTIVVGLILIGFFTSTLTGVDISRLGKQWNREFIVMRYGIFTYHTNDIISFVKSKVNNMFGYDEAFKNFREFYAEKALEETKTNKYTNLFKGKNIIAIHAESIQKLAMDLKINDREVTPNLNKLAQEGLFFSNFYAQDSIGTSSDTEFTLNTSLLPINNGTVFVNYWDRNYTTIPKLLDNNGYYAFSMHGNKGAFWNRNVMHKKMGYDYYYYYDKDFDLDENIGLGLSDKSFFRQAVPKIKELNDNGTPFYGTLIMLTNHTPFTDVIDKGAVDFDMSLTTEKMNEETGQLEVEKYNYLENTKMGSYLKSVNYADAAIGEFIAGLDEAGVLENTVIVIYGDHDAKLKKGDYDILYNYDATTGKIKRNDDPTYIDFDFYERETRRQVPFIIWSKNTKLGKEVKEVMGMYDVMPTLGNMFGFKNEYALGNDIFSVDKNIVVFPDGNWVTNNMYYNSQKKESKLFSINTFVSVEEIEANSKYAERILTVSEGIVLYDLIAKSQEAAKINSLYGN